MRKHIYTLMLGLIAGFAGRAQQVTVAVTTQPCNNNGMLQATATGLTGTITYVFKKSYSGVTLATNTTGILTGYSGGPVQVYASAGSNTASTYFAGAPPFNYQVTTTPAICPANGTLTATVTGGTSPYSVAWYALNGSTVLATGATASLPAGQYDVLITDAAGCTYGSQARGDSLNLWNQSGITFTTTSTNASCTNGTATVSAITGGMAPYSYLWTNGATSATISGLTKGGYYVTVTDAQGCSTQNGIYVAQTPNITVNTTVTNATCLQTNGSAIAFASGGVSPYTYYWSNTLQTTQTVTNLSANTSIHVVATDANGCTGDTYDYVQASTPITATYTATASSCTSATGSATVAATGGAAPYAITWNTYPTQTGVTATALAPGNYQFHITDANGCVRTGIAIVPPVSIITATVSATNSMCTASNGTASVLASSPSTPLSYLWSNGGTTAALSALAAGSYSVTITDNNGCHISKTAYVGTTSPISVGFNATQATCIFNNDAAITAVPTGGTAPYTYTWSSGAATATASSLPAGYYGVTIHDAMGCIKYGSTSVGYNAANSSCYCTITGTVYNDANTNCVKDAGEQGIHNIMVHASGLGYAYTNSAGVYSIIAPSGTYNLSESVQAYYPLATCQNNSIPVTVTAATGCTSTVNFGNTIATIHDIDANTTSYGIPPVPGNSYTQLFEITNDGTVTESSILAGYSHDGQLGVPTIYPNLLVSSGTNHYTNGSSFTTLTPSAHQNFYLNYLVPTNIPLGTVLQYNDSAVYTAPMSNWVNDYSPWNNVNAYQATVVGSYDPNYKEVTPKGAGTAGNIVGKDSVLTYTIHFQNTGTYKAQKVVLRDTLSGNVVIGSLKPGASSHAYTTTVSETGAVTFTFNNINLPDSASDRLGSNGFVTYSVHIKKNLAAGTTINNKASIYFDYNPPVVTNSTLNTIQNAQGVEAISSNGNISLNVFPNPATDDVTVMVQSATDNNAASLRFVNLLGQTSLQQPVVLQKGKNYFRADVRSLAAGMYFVEISNGSSKSISRLSVTR